MTVESVAARHPRVSLIDAERLYLALEEAADFAGSDMNIEGALPMGRSLRLFSRGNGAVKDGRTPLNATCDLALSTLFAFLASPSEAPVPRPTAITRYDLDTLDGLPIGFTDAAMIGGTLLYTGAAEASKDARVDGHVTGSVIGLLPPRGAPRYARLTDGSGRPTHDKVEGIVALPGTTGRVLVVVDADDPSRASELCEVSLTGDWR